MEQRLEELELRRDSLIFLIHEYRTNRSYQGVLLKRLAEIDHEIIEIKGQLVKCSK